MDSPFEGLLLTDSPFEGLLLMDSPFEGLLLMDSPFEGGKGDVITNVAELGCDP
jgi:hypothetical protein